METPDNEDPKVERLWCDERRRKVAEYLDAQGVKHGRIGEWPAWHVAPYVSIWAIESLRRPEWIGWWVISGDLPTDHISAADIEPPQHPRKALRAFAEQWIKVVDAWHNDREYRGLLITGGKRNRALAPLLASRARIFLDWSDDDSLWDDE
jgi:Domain of unknown function (DUF4826)